MVALGWVWVRGNERQWGREGNRRRESENTSGLSNVGLGCLLTGILRRLHTRKVVRILFTIAWAIVVGRRRRDDELGM